MCKKAEQYSTQYESRARDKWQVKEERNAEERNGVPTKNYKNVHSVYVHGVP
jgi:hypothetical protein